MVKANFIRDQERKEITGDKKHRKDRPKKAHRRNDRVNDQLEHLRSAWGHDFDKIILIQAKQLYRQFLNKDNRIYILLFICQEKLLINI